MYFFGLFQSILKFDRVKSSHSSSRLPLRSYRSVRSPKAGRRTPTVFFLRISQKPLCCCRGRSLPRWAYIPFENKNKMAKSGEAVTWQQGRARWWCKWRNRGGQNKKYIKFFFWLKHGRTVAAFSRYCDINPYANVSTRSRRRIRSLTLWLFSYFPPQEQQQLQSSASVFVSSVDTFQ